MVILVFIGLGLLHLIGYASIGLTLASVIMWLMVTCFGLVIIIGQSLSKNEAYIVSVLDEDGVEIINEIKSLSTYLVSNLRYTDVIDVLLLTIIVASTQSSIGMALFLLGGIFSYKTFKKISTLPRK